MSKADRIKEKKRKLNEGEELFKLEITVDTKNNISVKGPINDPLLVMQIFSGAMNVIVDHNFSTAKINAEIEAQRKEKEKDRIVRLN